ncbi:MAG TPA: hypothetical protein VGV91_10650 [Rubrobacter sp.]|nr:hypothetical protein [Rubrobacter sp.]
MECGSSGEENANLYVRGVEEGGRGEQPDPSELIELLDVFGEDGLRSYLMGFAEGREDAREVYAHLSFG